jgi:hypothetical protein
MRIFAKIVSTSLLLLQASSFAYAQIEPQVCACTPAFFAWTINLDNDCGNLSYITTGISEVGCSTIGSLDPVVKVRSIILYELGEDFNGPPVFSDTQENIDLQDGDKHYAPSIVNVDFEEQPTPFGYRIVAIGETAAGDDVTMDITIDYTNACEMEPVYVQGNTFGWFEFDANLSEPHIDKYCQLASGAPSVAPPGAAPTVATPTVATPVAGPSVATPVERCEGSSKAPKALNGRGGKGGKGRGGYSKSPTAGKGKGGKGKGGISSKYPKAGKGKGGCPKTKKGKTIKAGKGKGGKGKGYNVSPYDSKSRTYKARKTAEKQRHNIDP